MYNVTHLAIFASGEGSNTKRVIEYFRNDSDIKVTLIVCNKPAAGVLSVAHKENIPVLLLNKQHFSSGGYVTELKNYNIDFIILAGFLWRLPSILIKCYSDKILNIHPALLPAYGGKGMYGSFVHEEVIKGTHRQSGITIHLVDEEYDHGKIIFQATCDLIDNESAASLSEKIHMLEYAHYPLLIELVVKASTTFSVSRDEKTSQEA
jgi:formyltetrahydrofolate-dependent phosphoribosylglycinamide formyltransferase